MASSEIVDLRRLVASEFDVHIDNVNGLVGGGHVSVDGRTVSLNELRWRREDLAGRIVRVAHRERRVFGCRRIEGAPIEEVGALIDLTRPGAPVTADDQMDLFG